MVRHCQRLLLLLLLVVFASECAAPPLIQRRKAWRNAADPSASSLTDFVAWWRLDEESGTRNDESANAQHLTDNNTVLFTTGKKGNASAHVRASSEYLSRADSTTLSTGDIDFTFACWIRLTTKPAANAFIISKYDGASNSEYFLYYRNGSGEDRIAWSAGSTANILNSASLGSPSTATWYFVVCWHDASANTLNIQVNNGTVDSAAMSGGGVDNAIAFNLGATIGVAYFDGDIDEVGFWKRTLTAAEKTYLYNAGNGRTYTGGLVQ